MKASSYEEKFLTRYALLNKAQKEAVDTIEGPVMVIAGPGSGKTELLSLRVGNILRSGNAKASNILCLTFTETAARNMRERLESLIGPDAFRVAIYTFHGFCTDVIGRYPEYFFDHITFKPASDLAQSEILEEIFKRLPHKHVLAAYHPERGYAYLKESQVRIKDIKKGGLTPSRFKEILDENSKAYDALHAIVDAHMPERIGKDSLDAFSAMADAFRKTGSNVGASLAATLFAAIEKAHQEEKNTPLSVWKSSYTAKDDDGNRVLKEYAALPKLYALADVYEAYQKALYTQGLFDYEDMILQVVEVLSKSISLRTELEEQYHYIMVDEFQDTNNAQLSLVKALSSNEVHEGRANVCVVGDDDQAIYKFQGAEISNIHSFKALYTDVAVIVLTENYRSTQEILDFSRAVVTQGVHRLENTYKEIRKDLVAKNKSLPVGAISITSYKTEEEEYAFVTSEINSLLSSGVPAKEIAVIAREHRQLTTILPYLDNLHVPYTYTRKENVFDEQHVRELIILCEFLASVTDVRGVREELLPEILSFRFWGLDRLSVFKIATYSQEHHVRWLASMQASDDEKIREIALFLTELGVLAQTTPLEIILDTLIGSKDIPLVAEDEHEDFLGGTSLQIQSSFVSPYKTFYFGEIILTKAPSTYIHFLSSLRVFMRALREWRHGDMVKASDVSLFVEMHKAYSIPLTNTTPFAHNENSVELLTSHGAKGLEFSYVFIVALNDAVWAGGKKGSKLSFPANLPLASAGDDEDDFIRLTYVALTRARHTLYLTHHDSLLRYLQHSQLPESIPSETISHDVSIARGLSPFHAAPFAHDEKALLKKVIEDYKLSPTHLNNFLDITKGGPLAFLEQNILRFPQAKTASGVYGTAIHKAIEEAHVASKTANKKPELSLMLTTFKRELSYGRLLTYEEEKLLARGEVVLTKYYELEKESFDGTAIVEANFKEQGVVINGARITGKIDKMLIHDKDKISVIDVKTGKGFSSVDDAKAGTYDDSKLHHYTYQLAFYKLLIENSRDYASYTVTDGSLEFVEEEIDGTICNLTMSFDDKDMQETTKRVAMLIEAVYGKITTLTFPDTSHYEQSLKGVKQFEDDLLAGII